MSPSPPTRLQRLAAALGLLAMLLRALLPALHDHHDHPAHGDCVALQASAGLGDPAAATALHAPGAAHGCHCHHDAHPTPPAAPADPRGEWREGLTADEHLCLACAVELEAPGATTSLPTCLPAGCVVADLPPATAPPSPATLPHQRPPSRAPPPVTNA